ncbi:olfactory receptor 10A6-like [Cynoglossus semilaevis]|uniref:olfactory receptor 10A6-like n=1 Tax=Cynoglossus semilaevis TaxID=244447 RepID=UPI000D62CF13|nr:olfactory receptor 10A6-like [Cynoglossus semilaevis]
MMMMIVMNSTPTSYFILSAYIDIGLLKYVVFVFLLCFYILSMFSNLLLIVVICMNRSLHEPMYLFLCSLFVNELYGATALFPLLLTQVLSDVHILPRPLCFLQLYCLHTYGSIEYVLLGVLSYDRYLAICCPLQYNSRMTASTISRLVAAAYSWGTITCIIMICLSSSLKLCGNVIQKVYCDNYSVVRLACSETNIINIYGLIITFFNILFPLVLILFSYIKILLICLSGCKQSRKKVYSTCMPHLVSLINYSFGVSFEIVQSRFNMTTMPITFRIFMSLYWLTIQLLLNPLMYGFYLSKIRLILQNLPLPRL